MNKQSQWLFESPFVSQAIRRVPPKNYRHRQTTQRVINQALVSNCPVAVHPRTVYGWNQYRTEVKNLPPEQQNVVKQVGDIIVRSFKTGCQKVLKVQVYGYADHDTPRNPQREKQKSEERAQAVTNWLQGYVGGIIASQIDWSDTRGSGATKLQAPPTTEENRKKNRRVEIFVTVSSPTLRPRPIPIDPACLTRCEEEFNRCRLMSNNPMACLANRSVCMRSCQGGE